MKKKLIVLMLVEKFFLKQKLILNQLIIILSFPSQRPWSTESFFIKNTFAKYLKKNSNLDKFAN